MILDRRLGKLFLQKIRGSLRWEAFLETVLLSKEKAASHAHTGLITNKKKYWDRLILELNKLASYLPFVDYYEGDSDTRKTILETYIRDLRQFQSDWTHGTLHANASAGINGITSAFEHYFR